MQGRKRIAGVVLFLASCGSEPQGPAGPAGVDSSLDLILSGVIGHAPSPGPGTEVYLSLRPGAIPAGRRVTIRNLARAISVTTDLVDGGLDPVAVPAATGDELQLTVTEPAAGGQATKSANSRGPILIVRTSPKRNKTDVPLNPVIAVVFTEPIDLATSRDKLHLIGPNGPLAGEVVYDPGLPYMLQFLPFDLLAPASQYRLVVEPGVRGTSGAETADPYISEFTTTAGTAREPSVEIASMSPIPRTELPVDTTIRFRATVRYDFGRDPPPGSIHILLVGWANNQPVMVDAGWLKDLVNSAGQTVVGITKRIPANASGGQLTIQFLLMSDGATHPGPSASTVVGYKFR